MKFTLEIELGNDAMQTGDDIRQILRNVAHIMRISDLPNVGDEGAFRDVNGNTVGKWEVVD